jgi:hypothetical protein
MYVQAKTFLCNTWQPSQGMNAMTVARINTYSKKNNSMGDILM